MGPTPGRGAAEGGCQRAMSKSPGAFSYPMWWDLYQVAHSHDASPTSSLESHVTQMYTDSLILIMTIPPLNEAECIVS